MDWAIKSSSRSPANTNESPLLLKALCMSLSSPLESGTCRIYARKRALAGMLVHVFARLGCSHLLQHLLGMWIMCSVGFLSSQAEREGVCGETCTGSLLLCSSLARLSPGPADYACQSVGGHKNKFFSFN